MKKKSKIIKIVSGGQTGADRAGLDAAIDLKISHGGWCPKGRKAENGSIPEKYNLQETSSCAYSVRTEQNVIDSDATIVFAYGLPDGGSHETVEFAEKHVKPCLCIDLNEPDNIILSKTTSWLNKLDTDIVFNVAGSRESDAPGIHERVYNIMILLLKQNPK